MRKDGIIFEATVLDTCADSDCGGCCTRNAKKGGGFLIDMEAYTVQRHLGSLSKADGTIEWQLV